MQALQGFVAPGPASTLLLRTLAGLSHALVVPAVRGISSEAPLQTPGAATAAAASVGAVVPVERLQRAITPAVCEQLRRQGYAVVDNALGADTAARLREEVASVRGTKAMHKNCTHLVHGGSTGLLEKEHVWEAELMQSETQALAPLCAQVQHDTTLRVMLSVLMPEVDLQSQAIKLQWNAGQGGCFPIHFDSDMSIDTRRVTTIWYLNPDWKEGDGGELRVYPFPQAPVDIAPLNDRLVLFSSMHMPHRVLPSTAERYCFTVWMSQGGARRPHHTSSGGAGGGGSADKEREALRQALARPEPLSTEKAWRLLMHPELRKHAIKHHYRQEWERSLRESHPDGPQLRQALDTFWREVGVIERALAPLLPALVAGPPPGTPPAAWF